LLILLGGLVAAAICAGGLLLRSLRRIETTVPDYDGEESGGRS